jgi:hypothetical protein
MSIALELFFVRGDTMSSRDWAICHHPALKIVTTPGAPPGQQSVTKKVVTAQTLAGADHPPGG